MNNKTDQTLNSSDDKVSKLSLVIAIFASITLTILVLEWQGLLQHNVAKDDFPVAEYRAVFIEKQENKQYRLSHKPSNQTAVCNGGYLFITSDVNDGMQGLIVDYKNRGVRCIPGTIDNP
jgi:hypothetical protein